MSDAALSHALRALVNDKRSTTASWSLLRPVIERQARPYGRQHDVHDVTQEVVINLLNTPRRFEGDTDGAAVSYLKRATRNVIIGRGRRDDVRPKASDQPNVDDPYAHIIIADDSEELTWDDQAALLEDLLDRVRGEVDERIADSGKSALHRQSASNHAEATLMARVRNMDSTEIARDLGVPDTKSDTIAKWVERGRQSVLDAIDALARDAPADESQALAKLRELVAKRRKDAGVARPGRKRGGSR